MRGKTKGRSSEPAQVPQKTQLTISWRTCLRLVFSAFILYLCVTWWRPIASLIWHMLSAAAPLFLGFAIAYVVNILMSQYERWYFPGSSDKKWVRKTRRAVCLVGAIATVIGAVVLLLLIVVPQLVNAITVITRRAPKLLTSLSNNAQFMQMLPESIQTAIHDLDYNKLITGIMDFLTNGATPSDTTVASADAGGRLHSSYSDYQRCR